MKRVSKQAREWLDEYLPSDEPQGDVVDRANVVAEAFRRRSLEAMLGLFERTGTVKRKRARNRQCERCGKPITKERLRILPHTRRCVSCQRLFESQRRKRCISFSPLS